MTKSIPEPFIGNPGSARLVLLNLNPGHSERDEEDHKNSAISESMFHNLRHEEQEYPFYPLNPTFANTGVGEWWNKRTRALRESTGLPASEFAKMIFVIEWFPYHSKNCGFGHKPICGDSQRYSHELARYMLHKKNVMILGMKAKSRWVQVDNAFDAVPFLKSTQNAFLTRNNMQCGLFEQIVAGLKYAN